jgi:hypothetical protein
MIGGPGGPGTLKLGKYTGDLHEFGLQLEYHARNILLELSTSFVKSVL